MAADNDDDLVWGIVLAGRKDPGGLLMILDDKSEADDIAFELRRRDQNVEVVAIPRRIADGAR